MTTDSLSMTLSDEAVALDAGPIPSGRVAMTPP